MVATMTVTIDRSGMAGSPADLVLSGKISDGTALGLLDYQEPALQPRIRYAPSSDYVHGDLPLAWSWQQSVMSFAVMPINPANETAAQAALDDLTAAISRLTYAVTVVKSGVTEVWTCNAGSMSPAGSRTRLNLTRNIPVWSVSLPCYPVRS